MSIVCAALPTAARHEVDSARNDRPAQVGHWGSAKQSCLLQPAIIQHSIPNWWTLELPHLHTFHGTVLFWFQTTAHLLPKGASLSCMLLPSTYCFYVLLLLLVHLYNTFNHILTPHQRIDDR